MKTCCTCDLCRRAVRVAIERVWLRRRRWLRWWSILYDDSLLWVPGRFLSSVFGEMVRKGLIIQSRPRGGDPQYLLAAIATLPERREP